MYASIKYALSFLGGLIFKSWNPICKFRGVGKGRRMVDICCKNTLMKCMVVCPVSWLLNRIETGVDLVFVTNLVFASLFSIKKPGHFAYNCTMA